jgi:hypothetical protein
MTVLVGAACAGEEAVVEAVGLAHATMAEPISKSDKSAKMKDRWFRYICGFQAFLVYSGPLLHSIARW